MKQTTEPPPVTVTFTLTAEDFDTLRLIVAAWSQRYSLEGRPVPARVRSLLTTVNGGT